jgi:hypothetical protein
MDLADMSGLGDELWAQYGARILRSFIVLESGRIRNEVCFLEWQEAKRIFEARQESAKKTNEARSPHGHRNGQPSAPLRSADTRTRTLTSTETEKHMKASPSPQSVPPEELAGTLPLLDGSEFQVSKAQIAEWSQAYPAVRVREELRRFKVWLDANPTRRKTPKGIKRAVVRWLSRAQDHAPMGNSPNGANHVRTNSNFEVLQASIAERRDRGGIDDSSDNAGGEAGQANPFALLRAAAPRAV